MVMLGRGLRRCLGRPLRGQGLGPSSLQRRSDTWRACWICLLLRLSAQDVLNHNSILFLRSTVSRLRVLALLQSKIRRELLLLASLGNVVPHWLEGRPWAIDPAEFLGELRLKDFGRDAAASISNHGVVWSRRRTAVHVLLPRRPACLRVEGSWPVQRLLAVDVDDVALFVAA